MDQGAASNLDQVLSSNSSLSTEKPVGPGLGGGAQSEVFCKEVVLRLEAMCQHEDKKPELVSGEETTPFQTSTPNNTLEEFQPGDSSMGEELHPKGVVKAEGVTPSPVCPADLNNFTSSSSESECYQIPLQKRTLRNLTNSLFYPPPPPPSPGVAMGTKATPITPPAAQSPRQSTFVKGPAQEMEMSSKDLEPPSSSSSNGDAHDQTIVNEEPLVLGGDMPAEGADEAAISDQTPPPASIQVDEPPLYSPDHQERVQPPSVDPPAQPPSLLPVQPVVQSQPGPTIVAQQTDSAGQQTQAAAGMGGWYGGWGWGWGNQRGVRDAKYLVLSVVLLVISLFNPILFVCAVPAFIGAIVALVEGQNNVVGDMMMMGGVPGAAQERESELGRAMSLCSLACSVCGLVLCCLMLLTGLVVLIVFLVLGKELFATLLGLGSEIELGLGSEIEPGPVQGLG